MRKQTVLAVATMIAFLSISGAAAQGPQGAGSEKAAQSTHTPRSYNPIKWVKKDSNEDATTKKTKKVKNKKRSEKSPAVDISVPSPNTR